MSPGIRSDDVSLVEFMYFLFTCMLGESYCRRLRSLLLYLLHILSANYLPCVLILHKHSGPHSVLDLQLNIVKIPCKVSLITYGKHVKH